MRRFSESRGSGSQPPPSPHRYSFSGNFQFQVPEEHEKASNSKTVESRPYSRVSLNVTSEVKRGVWLIWLGFGLGASMASMGYHWIFSQSISLCFFVYWASCNVDANQVVRSVFFAVTQIFFKNFDVAGAARVPRYGPVIFACAPHANQFVDGLVVLKAVQHRKDLGFLTAAATMRRKYVGKLARALFSIGVERPQDLAKAGKGTIAFNGTTVTGYGTAFLDQVEVGSVVVLTSGDSAKAEGKVVSVTSNCELTLKSPGFQLKGGTTAPDEGASHRQTFKVIPHVDQSDVFESVFDRLVSGGSVGIFPEGGSHDRTELLPLKAGVSIMALGAMAKYPGLPLTIVPVGINYFKGHRFRSRVFVDIGAPITPNQDLVSGYLEGGTAKRAACGALLEEVLAGLKAVTVQAPDFKTLQFYRAVHRLYRPAGETPPPTVRFGLIKAFEAGYTKDQEESRVKNLFRDVEKYRNTIKLYGVPDHQIDQLSVQAQKNGSMGDGGLMSNYVLKQLGFHFCMVVLYGSVCLPGILLALPMFGTTRYISHKQAKLAKSKSSVKIAGRDVLATWKVMVSCVFVPLLHCTYTLMAGLFFGGTHATVYFFFMPFVSMFSILATEYMKKHILSSWLLINALVRKEQGLTLVAMRTNLQTEVREVVKQFKWDKSLHDDKELKKYIYGGTEDTWKF
mmetsp:Transcript_46799/g.92096  ORF Transcript_46799/g.92096 Transcript_46799/m.92096 type:complete len:679 (+) Transcript_46799:24-2060(+)